MRNCDGSIDGNMQKEFWLDSKIEDAWERVLHVSEWIGGSVTDLTASLQNEFIGGTLEEYEAFNSII